MSKDKILEDKCLVKLNALILMIKNENICQVKKYGIQKMSAAAWLNILRGELRDLSDQIFDEAHDNAHVGREAIQVATVALKIAEMHLGEE